MCDEESKKVSNFQIKHGDALDVLRKMDDESVQCVVTSPPYWGLRDYQVEGQIGLENAPDIYVSKLAEIFREVRRVLKSDGVVWLNIGDSYVSAKGRHSSCAQTLSGKSRNEPIENNRPDLRGHRTLKDKDLCGIPWRVAFALQADGWWLRQDIIWAKPNPMPESVTDRCTKSHEHIFMLSKNARYYYDNEAILELANYDGRKDTQMKGSKKYKNGYSPQVIDTIKARGHERWPNKKKGRTEKKAGIGYGGDGLGFKNHSGYYDGDGNERFYRNEQGEPARNKRDVWIIPTQPYAGAHFATFPMEIPLTCINAGSKKGDTIMDTFCGSGTTGEAALRLGRKFIGIELNSDYCRMAECRINAALNNCSSAEYEAGVRAMF